MIGLILALCSMIASLATLLLADDLVTFAFVVAGLLAAMAAKWKARPILLLLVYCAILLMFILDPRGLSHWLAAYDTGVDLGHVSHFIGAILFGLLTAGLLFALSCRKHSGGARFSAHEASEDIENLVAGLGRLSALLYLPLLILPVYFAANAPEPINSQSLNLVSWQEAPMLSAKPEVQMFVWFAAVIMLGGMAAACVRNVHHRYMAVRPRLSLRLQAWIEIFGSLMLLLPLCWLLVQTGWDHATAVREQSAVTMALDALVPGLSVPQWVFYIMFPMTFLTLALAGVSVILRSLLFLYGPQYLVKRSAIHLEMGETASRSHTDTQDVPAMTEKVRYE